MIQTSVLSDLNIDVLLNLSEVITAKEQIDKMSIGSVYFTVKLTDTIKTILNNSFKSLQNIDISNINSVPMRWIKGDTKPHIDRGSETFDKTYLVYLTNCQGKLVIDGKSYPILSGNAYIFSEGLEHKTIGTGLEPRLLLGPMSERGNSVGSSFNYPGGTTVYIRQISGVLEYSIDQSNWIPIGNNFPIMVTNSNISSGLVTIQFITNIILDNSSPGGVSKYFWCQSDYIQFGSTTLNANGNVSLITIDGIIDYPGLIRNGGYNGPFLPPEDGFNNIIVKNIGVEITNGSTLADQGGWICQGYFGRNGLNNYIINCYSTGYIVPGSGGIVGPNAASNGGDLIINKCFSLGYIDNEAGGIVGNNASNNLGNITITNCYSFGEIGGLNAGGIVGSFANQVLIDNCYSLGQISNNYCGGIIGIFYANNSSNVSITNCYSIGNIIGEYSGGIASLVAVNGIAFIQNCYTTGSLSSGVKYGIAPSGATITMCYSEGDNLSYGWKDSNASQYLTGINTIWSSIYFNTNYLLKSFNKTLYNQSPYSRSGNQTFTTELGLIQSSETNFKYYLINQPLDVTYNSTTGEITFGNNIEPGTYTINVVCGIDPPGQFYNYNINTFTFIQNVTPDIIPDTIPNVSICFPSGTPVLTDQGEISIEKIDIKRHTINGENIIAIIESIPLDSYLICIEKDSLAYNIPNRRTIISKDHKIMYKKLVRAEYLIQYIPTIYKIPYDKKKLYNVLLNKHSTMLINNLIVETMNPNNILAKVYTKNYTQIEKNEIIKLLNKITIKERKKSVISKNIHIA